MQLRVGAEAGERLQMSGGWRQCQWWRGEEDKNDNKLLVVEKGGQTAYEKGPWRGGRDGAGIEWREGECRCDVGSVAGGNWEDQGNDPGSSDPGRWTACWSL